MDIAFLLKSGHESPRLPRAERELLIRLWKEQGAGDVADASASEIVRWLLEQQLPTWPHQLGEKRGFYVIRGQATGSRARQQPSKQQKTADTADTAQQQQQAKQQAEQQAEHQSQDTSTEEASSMQKLLVQLANNQSEDQQIDSSSKPTTTMQQQLSELDSEQRHRVGLSDGCQSASRTVNEHEQPGIGKQGSASWMEQLQQQQQQQSQQSQHQEPVQHGYDPLQDGA